MVWNPNTERRNHNTFPKKQRNALPCLSVNALPKAQQRRMQITHHALLMKSEDQRTSAHTISFVYIQPPSNGNEITTKTP